MLSYVRRLVIMSFNQKEYIDKYNKSTYKLFPFRVRKDNTAIINKLSSVKSMNGYINYLIENDIDHGVLTLKQIKERIKPIMLKHKINNVYLFGSYSRGEANKDSDVDIYCDSGDIKTLLDEVGLVEELEKALGKKVDVVTIGSQMHDFFKQQLEEDKIKLW